MTVSGRLKAGRVAVAGLGGLGSNIAVMLARTGVGELFLVDFDKVEKSNLNRQHYNRTHLGEFKTVAIKSQIELINPDVLVEIKTVKITEENVRNLFADFEIVCEAFDNPQAKAMLVNAMLESADKKIIAACGMNGFDSANKIITSRRMKNLYICGDSIPAEHEGTGFIAPRVSVCAGHQANMVVRLLLGEESI
jgi:sulfur carrier protein ThiS adenylyltransferase